MRVAITDATYKHALALAVYLKRFDSKIEITGINPIEPKFSQLYKKHYSHLLYGSLKELLEQKPFDLVIPVGNSSVETLSLMEYPNAVLPKKASLKVALSKLETVRFAEKIGLAVPKTLAPLCESDLDEITLPYPLVVKGSQEAGKNVVFYANNHNELKTAFRKALLDPSQNGNPPIVQEYVKGTGLGFFAFYQKGELKRFYMHRRLREYPLSGGSATAAETYFHKEAFLQGKKLLDALQWNGPCMVEYKFDQETGRFTLMEINPKFWGSLELGLKAGINFGEYLINTIKNESLSYCWQPAYPHVQFFWPFDGDLIGIAEKKDFKSLMCYLKGGYSTNRKTLGSLLGLLRLAQGVKNWRNP